MQVVLKKIFVLTISLILQAALTITIYTFLSKDIWIINAVYKILGFLFALVLIKNTKNFSSILPWIIIIFIFPLAGILMYLNVNRSKKNSKIFKRIIEMENEKNKYLVQDEEIEHIVSDNSSIKYITKFAGYPATLNNEVKYLDSGEKSFSCIVEELKKAEKYIFIEFFKIKKGKMWDSILEILEEKAAMGVEVRIIYDGFACLTTLPKNYPKQLAKKNIKALVFNKMNPFSGAIINNRDHRKIIVIDNKVAFSGGINLTDEYINIRK